MKQKKRTISQVELLAEEYGLAGRIREDAISRNDLFTLHMINDQCVKLYDDLIRLGAVVKTDNGMAFRSDDLLACFVAGIELADSIIDRLERENAKNKDI